MLMAKLSTETRFSLASQPDGAKAISLLNSVISKLGVDKFITFLCLILDSTPTRLRSSTQATWLTLENYEQQYS